jgi:phage gp45-like
MSRTDSTIRETRESTGTQARDAFGVLRRMAVSLSSGSFWQAVGLLLLDQVTRETSEPEMFSGIGFYSRPREGANAEVVIGAVGHAQNPIILAARDEDTRKRMAPLDQDEAAIFNTQATVVVKRNGTVEIRLGGGVAQKTIRGETYRAAEDTLLTALGAFATAIGSLNPLTAPAAAVTLNAAINTFKAAASSYLTSVLKAQ